MSYETVGMAPEHREPLLKLWNENLSGLRSAPLTERYRWAYEQNPAGSARTLLSVHREGGEVIGCGSAYPRRLQIAGDSVEVGMPADFAVARAHRMGGAALAIQRALINDADRGFAALVAFPNKSALPVLKRVGYREITAASGWVKPLTTKYKLAERIASRTAARLASIPGDAGLAALDLWRAGRQRGTTGEVVDRADERFDTLWEEARNNYPIAGERTSAYLNWRYAAYTTETYRFFVLRRANGRLVGYVVFSTKDQKAFVSDVFATDMEDTATQVLLAFCRHQRRAGCVSVFVAFAGNERFTTALGRLGFFQRPGADRRLVAYSRSLTNEQTQTLFNAANWYAFEGEMDI